MNIYIYIVNNYLIIKHVVSVNEKLSLVFGFKKKTKHVVSVDFIVFGPNYLLFKVLSFSRKAHFIVSVDFNFSFMIHFYLCKDFFLFFSKKRKKEKGKMKKKN